MYLAVEELLTHILNAHVNLITANPSLQTGEPKSHTIYGALAGTGEKI